MSTELSIKSAESSFLVLKANCDKLIKQCSELTITDALSLKIANQQYSLLKAQMKEVEDYRVEIKAPGLDFCRQIDALASVVYDPMEIALNAGRKKVLSYNDQEKAKALAEQNRINAIKSKLSKYSAESIAAFDACKTEEELSILRNGLILGFPEHVWEEFGADAKEMKLKLNDYCKQRRIEINTPAQADETASEAIKEAIVEQVEEIKVVSEYVAPKGITGKFVHEIIDISQVPREYLMLDESAIKKFIKENSDKLSDGMIEGGIKFVWTENVKIR